MLGQQPAPLRGDRGERVLVEVGAGDGGDALIQKSHQAAQDARLGLAAEAQENEVVARQDGVHQAWQDGFLVADDAGKQLRDVGPGPQHAHHVVAHLVLDGALLRVVGSPQLREGAWRDAGAGAPGGLGRSGRTSHFFGLDRVRRHKLECRRVPYSAVHDNWPGIAGVADVPAASPPGLHAPRTRAQSRIATLCCYVPLQ